MNAMRPRLCRVKCSSSERSSCNKGNCSRHDAVMPGHTIISKCYREMVELAPQTKNQEERPLLKVEGGSGDGRPVPPIDSAWTVTCTKRCWFDRWPEFLTACWMTGILLAISFLMMYVLTIGTVKRQPVVILKCNASKPSSEVYYHQIIQRQTPPSFSLYEDYLAKMATTYPALHFNMIFMIDDTLQTNRRGFPHVNVYGRLIPFHLRREVNNFQNHNSLKIREFVHKYQNVNVTIIPLSEYMSRTQLKYKWRTLPLFYLSFYARISSVWQTGGIGIGMPIFSNRHSHQLYFPDKRVEMILKQHNDGIKVEDYRRVLETIERNEESEFISVICGIVNQMVKDTADFFNSSNWFPFASQKESNTSNSIVRTHRDKRDASDKGIIIDTSNNDNKNIDKLATVHNLNSTNNFEHITDYNKLSNKTNTTENNLIKMLLGVEKKEIITNKQNETLKLDERYNISTDRIDEFDYVAPNMFMSYQISLLSDDLGLMYLGYPTSEIANQQLKIVDRENAINMNKPHQNIPNFLTLSTEGSFVASTSVMHPLLGHLLSSGCKKITPKLAIQEAFLSQCADSPKNDVYCDNIYLLNLV
ncbi:uncharacterized protein LOC128673632 isoform X2 [Plodia interpunctella]|uniref:uncharacterized protein LOC128673632 isoform X2 n=1 Tax=Plodia interpunctella TaxID=58824 RepID=UPI00236788B1|nr:uncharacterized protein LOC128673632 isoform X2 [Plodia interpunctella]